MSKKQNNTNAKVIYVRNEATFTRRDGTEYVGHDPVATIAYEIVDESPRNEEVNGRLVVAYASALCHPNDHFVKSVGRAKAIGRLQSEIWREYHTFQTTKSLSEFTGKDWGNLERALRSLVVDFG